MIADFVIAAFYIGFICLFLALVLTPLAVMACIGVSFTSTRLTFF